MKKLTRKITLSLVAILFAVIALGTTTYAWFTLGTSATVSSIDGTVKAAEGIEVSLDGNNWLTNLSWSKANAQYKGTSIKDSTITLSDIALKKGTTEFYGVDGNKVNVNSSYLAFDLHIKVSGETAGKKITVSNVEIDSDAKDYTADVQTTKLQIGTTYNVFACNAARLSFATVKDANETYVGTFERGVAKAAESGNNFDGGTAEKDGHAKEFVNAKGFTGANEMFTSFDTYNNEATKTITGGVNNAIDLITTDLAATQVVRVFVWLNGFDGDCINAILGGSVSVSFQLNLATA